MLVGGARPNFMKIAPLYHAFRRSNTFTVTLVHTGQHYDDAMAGNFFRDLGLPAPDVALNVGSGTHGAQTARILERFEEQLLLREPDVVMVVGDVNSTIACALAASKIQCRDGRRPRIAHVEAGLRSGDRTMPEEVNRILTDAISDYLFVTEWSGVENLRREGHTHDRVIFVGNVMIDSLMSQAAEAAERAVWRRFGLQPQSYAVATLHRPSNVDDPVRLRQLADTLKAVSARLPVIFPMHPRTRARLAGRPLGGAQLLLCEPQPYVDFLSLLTGARLVLTDSGGIQEETTILRVPCLTLRENTERPVTIEHGTNRLIGTDPAAIAQAVEDVLGQPMPTNEPPPLWDGAAAHRIVAELERRFALQSSATIAQPAGV
jgi:UDP-N-acetylglucosamine 2-epimerase (non-hydrolysing)